VVTREIEKVMIRLSHSAVVWCSRIGLIGWLAWSSQSLAQTESSTSSGSPLGGDHLDAHEPDPHAQVPAEGSPVDGTDPSAGSSEPAQNPEPSLPGEPSAAATEGATISSTQFEKDSARMEAALEELSRLNRSSTGSDLLQLLLASINIGLGVYVGVDGAGMGDGYGRAATATSLIMLGSVFMGSAIRNFGLPSADENLFARFRDARAAHAWDLSALARF
jgi:hypothetical protein